MRKRLTATATVRRPPLRPLPREPRAMLTFDVSLAWAALLLLAPDLPRFGRAFVLMGESAMSAVATISGFFSVFTTFWANAKASGR